MTTLVQKYGKTAVRKSARCYGMGRGEFERNARVRGVMTGSVPGEPPLILLNVYFRDNCIDADWWN